MSCRGIEQKEEVGAELKTESEEKGVNESVHHLDRPTKDIL